MRRTTVRVIDPHFEETYVKLDILFWLAKAIFSPVARRNSVSPLGAMDWAGPVL